METFILYLVGIIGSTATYYVNTRYRQGAVRSSALLTLIVSGFLYFFPNVLSNYLTHYIPVVFIGASFIGMVSKTQLSTYLGLSLAGVIFTTILLNTSKFFNGYGGALGTSACISVLVVLSIPYFKSPRKMTVGLLQLRKIILKKGNKVSKGSAGLSK
mgnify:CR=1 FL=1